MESEATIGPSVGPVTAPSGEAEFTALYQREFQYVWHTLRRLGISTRDLPDVTHDVFVVVYRRLETFDRARPVKPWLFGVAFRVAADHLRLGRNAREQVVESFDVVPDATPGADEQMATEQTRQLVQDALASLDLDRRAVLIMHDIDGHAGPEIAAALSIPVKTMYSRLRVAREMFVAAIRRLKARRGER